jgi:small multidrug resistance family-3 protein
MIARSLALFLAAALAEIAGAYLIWSGLRENKGITAVLAGALMLVLYGVIAAQQPSNQFGRVLAAYGGVFVAGSLLWAAAFDSFHPDRYDTIGALICLIGAGLIVYSHR